jgi:hypothetical protein
VSDSDDDTLVTTPPAPPRRAANPKVDDVIHTGEIIARSHIVRASTGIPPIQQRPPQVQPPPPLQPSPPVQVREVFEEMSEPMRVPPPTPRMIVRPRRKAPIVWLLCALLPAIGAVVLHLMPGPKPTTSATPHSTELDGFAQLAGTMLDGEARAAQVRADAIASSSMLKAAIQTDARTLQDMVHDHDVTFQLAPNESLEIFQGTTSLLRLPADAAPITPPAGGAARLQASPAGMSVVVESKVGATGDVVLVANVDLGPLRARQLPALSGIAISGLGAPIQLGTPASAGTEVSAPITTTLAKGLSIVAMMSVPAGVAGNPYVIPTYVCLGLSGLFLLIFGGRMFGRH